MEQKAQSERQLQTENWILGKTNRSTENENERLDLAARHPWDLAAIWQEQKRSLGGGGNGSRRRGQAGPPLRGGGAVGGELLESLSGGRGRLRHFSAESTSLGPQAVEGARWTAVAARVSRRRAAGLEVSLAEAARGGRAVGGLAGV